MNLEVMQNAVFPRKGRRENTLSKLEFLVTQPKIGTKFFLGPTNLLKAGNR
jgi:hypothetical protein